MSGIGRISNSLVSGHNENTLSLAQINFNFALCRVDAPEEFRPLGSALSTLRRESAETGSSHRTARKLGALFEELVPKMDGLFKAYGKRVSEISQSPYAKIKESSSGIFQDHAGIDGTTIWAAATSGTGAIAVNLLACLLAELWTSQQATSIWAELVAERQKLIQRACDSNEPASIASIEAARQDISRDELRKWDASARAWLQIARKVKMLQHKQHHLIVSNLNLPVDNNTKTYQSVTRAWVSAMEMTDKLINGMPQRVQNGAILLALSAWHIYPDLLVFGDDTTQVRQKDSLVEAGGVLSVGLQNLDSDSGDGVFWSLYLGHLRYYGHPVLTRQSAGTDASLVSIDEFALVFLGSFLRDWCIQHRELHSGATILVLLWDHLCEAKASVWEDVLQHQPTIKDAILKDTSWFCVLAHAAKSWVKSDGANREHSSRLVKAGFRHGVHFLCPNQHHAQPMPVFGLCKLDFVLWLAKTDEVRIDILRNVCRERGFEYNQAIIRYLNRHTNMYEYASTVPRTRLSTKRDHQGNVRSHSGHHRWLPLVFEGYWDENTPRCHCASSCTVDCPCEKQNMECGFGCHSSPHLVECGNLNSLDWKAVSEMEARGERCLPYNPEDVKFRPSPRHSKDSGDANDSARGSALESSQAHVTKPPYFAAMTPLFYEEDGSFVEFHQSNIVERGFELAMGSTTCGVYIPVGSLTTPALPSIAQNVSLHEFMEILHQGMLRREAVLYHLAINWARTSNNPRPERGALEIYQSVFSSGSLQTMAMEFDTYFKSLRAVTTAFQIYKSLPGASVALKMIQRTIGHSRWARSNASADLFAEDIFSPLYLDRSQALACVAMFETGRLELMPESMTNVMAISSGNSIFASAPILCDPYEDPMELEIRRLVGNVGHAGVALLISPVAPKMPETNVDNWKVINHNEYDGTVQDSFKGTSLHLSFTGYIQPVFDGVEHGAQDTEVAFLESVVSIYFRGLPVADLDILKSLSNEIFVKFPRPEPCSHPENSVARFPITSVDCWEELIDRPHEAAIVRSSGNTIGRLAAAAYSVQAGYPTVVLPDRVCWRCIENTSRGLFDLSRAILIQ